MPPLSRTSSAARRACSTEGERTRPSTGISFSCMSGWRRASSRSDGSGASRTLSSGGLEAGDAAERDARLAEHAHLGMAVVAERDRGERGHLDVGEQPRAHALQLGEGGVPDRVVDDARLLGGADQRRVERLRDQHVDHGHRHVGAAMDVDRRVARADAQARLAGRVRGRHRLRAAGGPDEVDAGVVEEVLGDVERRIGDHLQRPRRHPGALAGLLEDLDGAHASPPPARRDGR